LEYPFENKQLFVCLLDLSREADKEAKIGVEVIISGFLERIFRVASTTRERFRLLLNWPEAFC
jgi:hypothetical protein